MYGGEVELEARLTNSIIGFGNMAYIHGQNISNDEPMRRIPPLNGRIGLRGNFIRHFSIMADWVFAADQDRLSSGDMADDRIAEEADAFQYGQQYFNTGQSLLLHRSKSRYP